MLRNEIRKIVKEEFASLKKEIVIDVINQLMKADETISEEVKQPSKSKAPSKSIVCYECKREDRTSFPNPNYKCTDMECEYYVESRY